MNTNTNLTLSPISEWIFNTARDVVIHTNSYTSSTDNPKPDAKIPALDDEKLQKLIDGALFNEKIISTYPLLILGIVLVISGVHWSGKAIRWRRRVSRKGEDRYHDILHDDFEPSKTIQELVSDDSSIGSSGSSNYGSNTPITLDTEDEQTPLLQNHCPKSFPSIRITITSHVKALLIYQPPPIPYINKALPSNGSSLFILSFLSLNIFYTFYNIPFAIISASILGDRAALVFGVNLPLLYILGAKNQPLKILTGVSYESLNILHRRLCELLILEALIHASGMFVMWYTILEPYRGWSFLEWLSHRCIYLGLMALITYKLLYVTSLASFRQRWYELFLGLHVVLQAGSLVILYFHHRGAKTYVKLALGVFLVDRLIYRVCAKSVMAEANVHILPDKSTVLLTFHLPKYPHTIISHLFSHSITSGWSATDHIFLTIPSLGLTHSLQAHPFTIASPAPLPHSHSQTSTLTLLIRARAGFTSSLLRDAQLKKTLTCRLEGPYGGSHARDLLEDSDLAVLVAGGSGIAVTWPIIHHLLHISGEDTECASISMKRQRIVLIWITHKPSHLSWMDEQERQEIEKKGVEIVIPGATIDFGRPDLEGMVQQVVDDWGVSCGKERRKRKRIGVVVSGPDGMNRMVNNKCAELVRTGRDLKVAVEKFGW